MKSLKALFGFMLLGVLMVVLNSCSEDNPVIERSWSTGPTENGDLEVFVKTYASSTYWGPVKVNLYLSEEDMNNGDVYMTNYTDEEKPEEIGALFEDLENVQYWASCSFIKDGSSYTGWATTWVPKGGTTRLDVPVQK